MKTLMISTGLMIMVNHQTFSGQIKHMSDQIRFGLDLVRQVFYTFINGEVIEFAKDNESGQFLLCGHEI